MALIAIRRQPIIVPVSQGPALVPSGGVVAPPGTGPLAGQADQTGALGQALVAPGQVMPLADEAAQAVALAEGRGGAARGALIDHPENPAPLLADDNNGSFGGFMGGNGGGLSALKMLAGMGKAAGESGGDGPLSGPTDDGGGMHVASDSSPGLMDRIKDFFLGANRDPAPSPDPAQIDPGLAASDLSQQPVPLPVAGQGPALPVDDPSGGPTARPSFAMDAQPGLDRVAAAEAPAGALDQAPPEAQVGPALAGQDLAQAPVGPIDTATPKINAAPEPNFLDKLRGNPLALMLISGGLGTMAAASRRGATPLGAIGEGMGAGLGTAFEAQAAERGRELEQRRQDTAEQREADEEVLRGKQGAFYDARSAVEPAKAEAATTRATAALGNADANKTRAGAAVTNAAASTVRANAAQVRADAYAKGGGPGGAKASVFEQKKQAWLAIHPNDQQGSLDYAAGHKNLSGSEKYLAARRLATSQLNGMVVQPDNPNKFLDDSTKSIMSAMDKNDGVKAAPPKASGPALGGKPAAANAGALHDQALAAIKRGAPADAVRQRYQKMTGQNADF